MIAPSRAFKPTRPFSTVCRLTHQTSQARDHLQVPSTYFLIPHLRKTLRRCMRPHPESEPLKRPLKSRSLPDQNSSTLPVCHHQTRLSSLGTQHPSKKKGCSSHQLKMLFWLRICHSRSQHRLSSHQEAPSCKLS